jgi:hypothetical protein
MNEDLKKFGHPKFYELLDTMAGIHSRKNHDYAGATGDPLRNFKASVGIGIEPWRGALLRLQDKMMRVENFAKYGILKVTDECVEDTLVDLANYALLTLILYQENSDGQTKPNVNIHEGMGRSCGTTSS